MEARVWAETPPKESGRQDSGLDHLGAGGQGAVLAESLVGSRGLAFEFLVPCPFLGVLVQAC